jgi:hypothetical protein
MGCGPQKNVRIDARSNARKPENVLEKNVRSYLGTAEGKKCQKISGNIRGEKYGKMMKSRNCGQKKNKIKRNHFLHGSNQPRQKLSLWKFNFVKRMIHHLFWF